MSLSSNSFPSWLTEWMEAQKIVLWGMADLRDFSTPQDETGQGFSFALSWGIPMNPQIMVGIRNGPNQTYAEEYARVNDRINELSAALAAEIKGKGFRAKPLAASDRTDAVNIRGDFPHKTAATRAGLGWVGRNCQLITQRFGPWIRLGTVFTDIELPCGPPDGAQLLRPLYPLCRGLPCKSVERQRMDPGIPREEILDVQACDQWKKEHYFQYHKGHNCGICSSVCPYGLRVPKTKLDDKA